MGVFVAVTVPNPTGTVGRGALGKNRNRSTGRRSLAKPNAGVPGTVVAVAQPRGEQPRRLDSSCGVVSRREAAASGAALALSALVAGPAVGDESCYLFFPFPPPKKKTRSDWRYGIYHIYVHLSV